MTARILIIDAVPTNRIVLRVKLNAAYYQVFQASDTSGAMTVLARQTVDLIVIASRLEDHDICPFLHELRAGMKTRDLPIIAMADGFDPARRLALLAAGADEVVERPIDDTLLLARVRSLLRVSDAEAELRLREDTRRALGLAEGPSAFQQKATVAFCGFGAAPVPAVLNELKAHCPHRILPHTSEDILRGDVKPPGVLLLAEGHAPGSPALAILPTLRAHPNIRHSKLIYVCTSNRPDLAARALDLGADDVQLNGAAVEELALRLDKQIQRKSLYDRLRANVQDGLRAAVIDPLTGLFNRRYALPHIQKLAQKAAQSKRPMSLILADIDHFKAINDTHGHAFGDQVLTHIAQQLVENLRLPDVTLRLGGEEFLMALPNTPLRSAVTIAHRLKNIVQTQSLTSPNGQSLQTTLSMGVTSHVFADAPALKDIEALIDQADQAMYGAKERGRNRVEVSVPDKSLPKRQSTAPLFTHKGAANDPLRL